MNGQDSVNVMIGSSAANFHRGLATNAFADIAVSDDRGLPRPKMPVCLRVVAVKVRIKPKRAVPVVSASSKQPRFCPANKTARIAHHPTIKQSIVALTHEDPEYFRPGSR